MALIAVTHKRGSAERAFIECEATAFAAFGMRPVARSLRLDEPGFRHRALEAGAGEPVLFMHGIFTGPALCAPLMGRLEGSRRRVAIDMPGHGLADQVDFDGVDLRRWHTRMLIGCMQRLGIESAHLVGHSYGGMFALWLALDAPERVRSVTCLGAPAIALGAHPDPILQALRIAGLGPMIASIPSLRAYRHTLAYSLGRHAVEAAPPELIRAIHLATRRRGFGHTVSTYLREQFHGTSRTGSRYTLADDDLRRIRRPVLVVWGEQDRRYQHPAEGGPRVRTIPGARFETVPGGHAPWLDDLDRCARLVSTFVGEHAAAAGRSAAAQ